MMTRYYVSGLLPRSNFQMAALERLVCGAKRRMAD
jgi:hypothetical protein